MEHFISAHEMRRRAPLHYWARADNARYTAFGVWALDVDFQARCAESTGYRGTPEVAMVEAFHREAALALELIIKAVIALRIERHVAMRQVVKVRPTHDLISLWTDAQLPDLSPDDQHRLMIARRILYWSGRYAAPRRDEDYVREQQAMEPLEEAVHSGGLKFKRLRSFTWDDFDRIYQVAATSFLALGRHEGRAL